MASEDQYMERTPDLVAKIRAMREAADKQMNRFTRVADYDVRRVVGQMPKAPPVSGRNRLAFSPGQPPEEVIHEVCEYPDSDRLCAAHPERGDDGEIA